MNHEQEHRRTGILLDAIDPATGQVIKVQLSHQRLQSVASRSKGQVLEAGYIVPEILQHPTAIFEGLTQEEDEDRRGVGWRCYCGAPSVSYRTDGTEQNPFPRQVYLVFVNHEGIAYNWRWERSDPEDNRLPENHKRRFKRKVL
jgi:hypothetical protein